MKVEIEVENIVDLARVMLNERKNVSDEVVLKAIETAKALVTEHGWESLERVMDMEFSPSNGTWYPDELVWLFAEPTEVEKLLKYWRH